MSGQPDAERGGSRGLSTGAVSRLILTSFNSFLPRLVGFRESFPGIRFWPSVSLFLCLAGCAWGQVDSGAGSIAGAKVAAALSLPRFEDYRINESFTGRPAAPKLLTRLEQTYAGQIRDGVEKGDGVFQDGMERKGPNFAGSMAVIQWACGAPCTRMAVVDERTGDVYYPPISFTGIGTRSFDLPLLAIGDSVPQNPEGQFRPDSSLMIIKATPSQSGRRSSYTYYFLWRKNRWTLLRKVALDQH